MGSKIITQAGKERKLLTNQPVWSFSVDEICGLVAAKNIPVLPNEGGNPAENSFSVLVVSPYSALAANLAGV